MARRNDHSREEIREMSLEAAEAILSSEGADALSVRRIAQSIGYTHGTLYLVFDNLDALLLEINRRTLDRLTAALEQAACDSAPGAPRMRALAIGYLEFARGDPERFRLVFEHRMADDAPPPEWLQAQLRRGYSLLEQALEECGARDPAPLAAALWCTVHGATVLALDDALMDTSGGLLDAREVLARAVSVFGTAGAPA